MVGHLAYIPIKKRCDVGCCAQALVTGDAHVWAIAERLAYYATGIRADVMHTADVEDANTIRLYIDMSRGIKTWVGGVDVYLCC
jgi:hypothetical protein